MFNLTPKSCLVLFPHSALPLQHLRKDQVEHNGIEHEQHQDHRFTGLYRHLQRSQRINDLHDREEDHRPFGAPFEKVEEYMVYVGLVRRKDGAA